MPARVGNVQGMQGATQLRPGLACASPGQHKQAGAGVPLPESPMEDSELLRASSRVAVQERKSAAEMSAPLPGLYGRAMLCKARYERLPPTG